MLKPTTTALFCNASYYFQICINKGESDRTIECKESNLNKFIEWALSNDIDCVNSISLDVMDAYTSFLHRYRQPNGKSLTSNTIRNKLTCIKTFIDTLYKKQLVDSNTLVDMTLPKKVQTLPSNVYEIDEVESVLQQPNLRTCTGRRDRVILETLFGTGIRRNELRTLNVNNLNPKNGTLTVWGKGNKQRVVPLAQRTLDWLFVYIKVIRPQLVSSHLTDALFLTNKGKPISNSSLSGIGSKYVKQAGLTRYGACHIFRHVTATEMLNNGADLRFIQELLGHASITTTQIYTRVSKQKLKEVHSQTHPSALTSSGLF